MNKDRLIGAMTAIACVIAVELIMPLLGTEAGIVGMIAMFAYYVLYFLIVRHNEKQAIERARHEQAMKELQSQAGALDDTYKRKKDELLSTLNMQLSNEINRINSEIYGED